MILHRQVPIQIAKNVTKNVVKHYSGFLFSFKRLWITSMGLMHCFGIAPIFNLVKIKIKYWCSAYNYLQWKIRSLFTIQNLKIVYNFMWDTDVSPEILLFISRCLVRWKIWWTLTFALLINFVKVNIHVIFEARDDVKWSF